MSTMSTGDARVDAALAALAGEDPGAADAARAGFEALSFGEGMSAVTMHALADFLWHRLPARWRCDVAQKFRIADALGRLFSRVGKVRYAAMCHSPATGAILAAYHRHGEAAGFSAYRKALAATGVQPPDVPGGLAWGSVLGTEEAVAYWSASRALERAIESGELVPGVRGWRRTALEITTRFLDRPHPQVPGTTWRLWLQTERLEQFTETGGPTRTRLARAVADTLVNPLPAPAGAAQRLAPLRWLLDLAADGAPLTANGTLARALVADGCRRFDWLTPTGNPRSEYDIPELVTLRELVRQMGSVRRSGRRLLLSRHGATLHTAGDDDLWESTMSHLLDPGDGEAAAGELALMLLLAGTRLSYQEFNTAVAAALAEEGWCGGGTGQPVGADHAASLLAPLRRRLWLLDLQADRGLGEPAVLNEAGRAAAHTALRAHALRPRNRLDLVD